MFGRLIIALLMIGAAAVVTMERETAVVADMSADLAESKYTDAEDRAKKWEARAVGAEAKAADLEIKNQWLEAEVAEARRLRELALMPLEVKHGEPSMKGAHDVAELQRVAALQAATTHHCFARAPERGRAVTLRWVVRMDGRVTSPMALETPEGFDEVVSCLVAEVSTWTFKPMANGLSLAQLTWKTGPVPVVNLP